MEHDKTSLSLFFHLSLPLSAFDHALQNSESTKRSKWVSGRLNLVGHENDARIATTFKRLITYLKSCGIFFTLDYLILIFQKALSLRMAVRGEPPLTGMMAN
jgi:hypothetical protein